MELFVHVFFSVGMNFRYMNFHSPIRMLWSSWGNPIFAEKQASVAENISYHRAQACIQINKQNCRYYKFSYIKVNSTILGSF